MPTNGRTRTIPLFFDGLLAFDDIHLNILPRNGFPSGKSDFIPVEIEINFCPIGNSVSKHFFSVPLATYAVLESVSRWMRRRSRASPCHAPCTILRTQWTPTQLRQVLPIIAATTPTTTPRRQRRRQQRLSPRLPLTAWDSLPADGVASSSSLASWCRRHGGRGSVDWYIPVLMPDGRSG